MRGQSPRGAGRGLGGSATCVIFLGRPDSEIRGCNRGCRLLPISSLGCLAADPHDTHASNNPFLPFRKALRLLSHPTLRVNSNPKADLALCSRCAPSHASSLRAIPAMASISQTLGTEHFNSLSEAIGSDTNCASHHSSQTPAQQTSTGHTSNSAQHPPESDGATQRIFAPRACSQCR